MAFLGIDALGICGTPAPVRAAPLVVAPVSQAVNFSQLEWTVVGLARHDAPRRAAAPVFVEKLLRALLGTARDSELANPRLEALRRTALSIRRWGSRVPDDIINAFHDAGFSRAQLNTLIHSVEIDLVSRQNGRLA